MAIEKGFVQVNIVVDSDINIEIKVKAVIYKCENWTHSLSFKGFSAPYTILYNYAPHQ
jgi:hypothetical protein